MVLKNSSAFNVLILTLLEGVTKYMCLYIRDYLISYARKEDNKFSKGSIVANVVILHEVTMLQWFFKHLWLVLGRMNFFCLFTSLVNVQFAFCISCVFLFYLFQVVVSIEVSSSPLAIGVLILINWSLINNFSLLRRMSVRYPFFPCVSFFPLIARADSMGVRFVELSRAPHSERLHVWVNAWKSMFWNS